MRFIVKRITSVQIIITEQYSQIILTGIYDSGNEYCFIFNFVQGNMFPTQEHSQLCLKSGKGFDGRPLFWISPQLT